MNSKKILFIILGALVVIALVFGFYYWFQEEAEEEEETGEKIIGPCADFSIVEGEISCQKAIGLALGEYPGEVSSVDKAETLPLLEDENPTGPFWVVGVNLDEPIEKELPAGSFATSAEIFINIETGSINALQLK